MLRACREVLRPGGRIGGYSIYARVDDPRAAELGPSEVLAGAPLEDLYRAAGFRGVIEHDVTPEFGATCEAFVQAGSALRGEAKDGEPGRALEEELERKTLMLQGVSEGLLGRSLVVASRT